MGNAIAEYNYYDCDTNSCLFVLAGNLVYLSSIHVQVLCVLSAYCIHTCRCIEILVVIQFGDLFSKYHGIV